MRDQTRRDWVLTISGTAAAGLGVAWTAHGDALTLPPGVYLPSTDHLGHALMSADQYHPIPPGCPTDYVSPPSGSFQPLFFSKLEFPAIHRLTALMLGEVSGNSSVIQEVSEWIDLRLSTAAAVQAAELRLQPLHSALADAYFGYQERHRHKADSTHTCREGLAWIASAARDRQANAQRAQAVPPHKPGTHANPAEFLLLDMDQQTDILHSISDDRPGQQNENAGTRFFTLLKTEIIRGFYTSRTGLQELNFKGNAFYARSPGCQSKL